MDAQRLACALYLNPRRLPSERVRSTAPERPRKIIATIRRVCTAPTAALGWIPAWPLLSGGGGKAAI